MGMYGEKVLLRHQKLLSKTVVMAIMLIVIVQFGKINSQSGCTGGSRCLGTSGYCSGGSFGSRSCVSGYCRCPNNPSRDYCTCRPISGSCHVIEGAPSADRVGDPRFDGLLQSTQSCVANENCNYDVHIISNYESDGRHGFGVTRTTGTTNVNVRVTGEGSKPLVLVFVSYEPIRWILSVPQGVVIDRVLLGSYYLSTSSVSYTSGTVRSYERQPYSTLPYGRGEDSGGGNTVALLDYVVGRFGHIASFTSTYRANNWTLNIERTHTPGCSSDTSSVTQPTCVACTTLVSPTDGAVTFSSSSRSVGTTAYYTCDSGYRLSGSSIRTCLSSCLWSGSQPLCERQTCSRLSDPSNGDVVFSSSTLSVGTSATYRCDSGYSLVDGSSTRTCLSSGSWSGSAPYCRSQSLQTCTRLSDPSNGDVVFSSSTLSVGTSATYRCDSGYSLVDGSSTRTCLSSGSWSGSTPYCRSQSLQTCSRLYSPSNGYVSFSSSTLSVGTTARYSCSSGYILRGSSSRTCLSSGVWSGYTPNCDSLSTTQCFRLTDPSHGTVRFTSNTRPVGSRAVYTCDFRYYLVGTSTRTCQSSGSWSGSPPYCRVYGSSGADSSNSRSSSSVVGGSVGGSITGVLFLVGCFGGCILLKWKKNRSPLIRRVPQAQPRISGTPCVVRTRTVIIRARLNSNCQNPTPPNASGTGIRLNTYPKSELQEQPPPDYSTVMDYKTASAQAPTSDPPAYHTLINSGVKRSTVQNIVST